MKTLYRVMWLSSAALLTSAALAACAEGDDEQVFTEPVPEAGVGTPPTPPPPPPPTPRADAGVDASVQADAQADAEAGPRCGADGFCLTESPSTAAPPNETITLRDVWIDQSGRTWAVGFRTGGRGVILTYEAGVWTTAWTGVGALEKISGDSNGEIWAMGGRQAVHGVPANGTWTWTVDSAMPISFGLGGMLVAGPGDVWVCGLYTGIVHRTAEGSWPVSVSYSGPNFAQNFCGSLWADEAGQVWGTMTTSKYEYIPEYDDYGTVNEYSIIVRNPPAAVDGGVDDGGTDAGVDPNAITDGWATLPETKSKVVQYFSGSAVAPGVHWVLGRSAAGPLGMMRSQLVDGKVTFGPMVAGQNPDGTPLNAFISDFWATPTQIWATGTFGLYRSDGQTWTLLNTAIDGLPLLALGSPSALFGNSNQVVVVGEQYALRLEVNP